jgi:formate-dependent nitrite reductase membrane component NrfD
MHDVITMEHNTWSLFFCFVLLSMILISLSLLMVWKKVPTVWFLEQNRWLSVDQADSAFCLVDVVTKIMLTLYLGNASIELSEREKEVKLFHAI